MKEQTTRTPPKLRVLSAFLAVAMLLTLLPAAAFAAPAPESDFEYGVNKDTATITKYKGAGGTVEIPATLGGYPVTGIQMQAFIKCTSLKSVSMPESMTWIGDSAFAGCTGLEQVEISPNLTAIGSKSFYSCSDLTSVVIPDKVTSIESLAFFGCLNLESITIPASVTTLDSSFVYGCTNLKKIEFKGTQEQWNALSIDPNYLPVGVSIVCADGTIGGGSDPNVKNYSLTVCGKAVTSANCDNILEDPAGTTPRAVYDPDSKTLTLNGTIKATAADTEQTGAIIKTEDALTITGNAALEWDGGDSDDAPIGILAAGVTAETGKLTLSGAVLEITADAGGIDLLVGSLTIENQTRLTVKSGGICVCVDEAGTLEISNSQLDLDTADDAIWVGGTARIENSTLTINGLDEYNDEGGMHALITKDGDLIVENSTITAMDTGDEGYYYQYGLWLGGKLEVSNSVLTLGAQDCAMNADSMEARDSNSKITAAVDGENHVPVQVDDPAVILHDDLKVTEGALNTECPKVVIEYASPHKVEGDYTYEITTDGNVRILAYDGSEADVVVPATLGGRDVTEIGNSARPVFDANAAIRSITFPDTLKEMSGLPLFHECENLETITIPASVTGMNFNSVEDCFISNCPNLRTIIFKGTRAQWEAIEKESVDLDGITVRCSDGTIDPVNPKPDPNPNPDPGDPDDEDVFLQFEDCSVDVEKPDGTTLHFDATGVKQSQRLPKGAKVTITLDENAIPAGMKFSCWVFDPRPEDLMEDGTTATFTMQEDIGVLAKFSMLEEEDSSADFGTIAAATAVVGVVGATAYLVGTEVALNQLLPAGTSVPQDRAQLALLLWNTAGRPEPAALPAFADVTDPDTAKAAQWCVEAGFFQPREDGNFKPGKHVSRWKVLRTYQRIVK